MEIVARSLNSLLPRSLFTRHFVALNRLSRRFRGWKVEPGMGFREPMKWWGDGKERATPHEGLDFLRFVDDAAVKHSLDPAALFPPFFAGDVVGIFPDFLGESILFRHDVVIDAGLRLYSVFAHTVPVDGIAAGVAIQEGRPVARLVNPGEGSLVPPHLHVSLMWISQENEGIALDWGGICSSHEISLVDPLEVI